ncbi:MAG: hypothetical protein ABJF23_33415 [Bryobacteraceae bacterium]
MDAKANNIAPRAAIEMVLGSGTPTKVMSNAPEFVLVTVPPVEMIPAIVAGVVLVICVVNAPRKFEMGNVPSLTSPEYGKRNRGASAGWSQDERGVATHRAARQVRVQTGSAYLILISTFYLDALIA